MTQGRDVPKDMERLIVKLLQQEPKLSVTVIATRAGCSKSLVNSIRKRHGMAPRLVEKAEGVDFYSTHV